MKASLQTQELAQAIAAQCYAFIQGLPDTTTMVAKAKLIAENADTLLAWTKLEAAVTS